MKHVPLMVVLVLSVAAHAVLWWTRGASPAEVASQLEVARIAATVAAVQKAEAAQEAMVEETQAALWSDVGTGDLEGLVARWRDAGVPRHLLRAMVAAEVRRRKQGEVEALLAEVKPYRYWDSGDALYLATLGRDYQRLREEMDAEVATLLGGEVERDPYREVAERRQYGELPAELSARVSAVVSDYGDLRANLYMTSMGVITPEDEERLAFLEAEERRDLEELLTPEQLFEYRLRNDQAAQMLRTRLGVMGVTEAEFRAIYQASEELNRTLPEVGQTDFSFPALQARRERTTALVAALGETLPPERQALLEQALDPSLMMLNNLVARYGLEPQVARRATELQTERIQEVTQLRNNSEMDPAEREAAVATLREKTFAEYRELLGEDGLAAYRRFGGQWMDSMFNAPTAPGGGG
ncbi:hypothetical protein [Actomonas aquatica]|uniref:Lipase helper protein n=1 Tax=Actomonas aquatica TaxID=2866162 RepID=A0ABZ1C7Q4_9BACT|nr:hypothetical protein [Opitutus sp. WL0086]WRQ86325.1 hypothetical protein K1X11_016030 [Opitutus sp. WL0086]